MRVFCLWFTEWAVAWFVFICVFDFVCECVLLLSAFVCFVRTGLCDVVWCVALCVVSVLVFFGVNCV